MTGQGLAGPGLSLSDPSVMTLPGSCFALQALAGDQPAAQPSLRPQQLAPQYTYPPGGQQTWVRDQLAGHVQGPTLLGGPAPHPGSLHGRPQRGPWWVSTGWT